MKIGHLFRAIGKFKGKHRLARLLLGSDIRRLQDFTVTGKYQCTYLIPNIIENVGFDIYVDGMFEEDSVRFIASRISRNGTWIDIGANIGSISIPVCTLRKDTTALCIEASPRVFRYLEHNRQLNSRDNMILVNRAVTDQDGQQLRFYSPEDKFGKGSLVNVYTNNYETVTSITIDHLLKQQGIRQIDFIKVDVEGFEYYVFKGSAGLLSDPGAPDILFEFIDWSEESAMGRSPGDAQRLLVDYGYKLFSFGKKGELLEMKAVISSGYSLIFATKKITG